MEKRRNCSLGAISPLFHNIFNIPLTSRVQLHIYLLNVVVPIIFSSILQIWYVQVQISKYFRESLAIWDNKSRLSFLFQRRCNSGFSFILTFTNLWANSADHKLMIFFLLFPRKQVENLHEISKPDFWGKVRKIFPFVVYWKFYPEC